MSDPNYGQPQGGPPGYPPPPQPMGPPPDPRYIPPQGYYPAPQYLPQPPAKKRNTWVWVLVIVLVTLCGCPMIMLGGLYKIGTSYIAKTQNLIASAPSDGSAVALTLKIGSSTNVASQEQVALRSLVNPMDIYEVQLQPSYAYYIGEQSVTMDEFYQATKAQRLKNCELTYARSGIKSLKLIE